MRSDNHIERRFRARIPVLIDTMERERDDRGGVAGADVGCNTGESTGDIVEPEPRRGSRTIRLRDRITDNAAEGVTLEPNAEGPRRGYTQSRPARK
jgi:hypothetical protein